MIYNGDVREVLPNLPDESVDCIITSPPYYQLRDYGGFSQQIGNEDTYQEYLSNLVSVFSECKRILKNDGTMWINIGDKYAGSGNGAGNYSEKRGVPISDRLVTKWQHCDIPNGNMMMLPARLAISLQDSGWYVRNEIIWEKPNAMPNGGKNPLKLDCSHEIIYLMTKQSSGYYFNIDAVKVKSTALKPENREWSFIRARKYGYNVKHNGSKETGGRFNCNFGGKKYPDNVKNDRYSGNEYQPSEYRRLRDVWHINTQPYSGAHFACYPEELVRRCILAGCRESGVVMDCFSGSGTTGKVAYDLGRQYIGIELNPEYVELSKKRMGNTMQKCLEGA